MDYSFRERCASVGLHIGVAVSSSGDEPDHMVVVAR
jgi:hypothetical protein